MNKKEIKAANEQSGADDKPAKPVAQYAWEFAYAEPRPALEMDPFAYNNGIRLKKVG